MDTGSPVPHRAFSLSLGRSCLRCSQKPDFVVSQKRILVPRTCVWEPWSGLEILTWEQSAHILFPTAFPEHWTNLV